MGNSKKKIDEQMLKEGQLAPLQQRMETLESFMVQKQAMSYDLFKNKPGPGAKHTKTKKGTTWTPKAGQLTIVDLSCPCVTAEVACSLFGICLS
ncbi:hypothetical protein QQZ08_001897 [Neonectria magnoliae]|uniref:Uncharacterized protein n=1 Tax=Neonectria magnoliae TaxID=2732573 RepID=A0ABR1IDN0_9HYPO